MTKGVLTGVKSQAAKLLGSSPRPVSVCGIVRDHSIHVNTTPQMTYIFGAKRLHKIATGKSFDELLQHDNKMRI